MKVGTEKKGQFQEKKNEIIETIWRTESREREEGRRRKVETRQGNQRRQKASNKERRAIKYKIETQSKRKSASYITVTALR